MGRADLCDRCRQIVRRDMNAYRRQYQGPPQPNSRQLILELLEDGGGYSRQSIAEMVQQVRPDLKEMSIRRMLWRMRDEGLLLEYRRGVFYLA